MNELGIFELWLKSKQDEVKPSTYALYRRICLKILYPECKDIGIVEGFRFLVLKLPHQYKFKTAKDITVIMNQILHFAFQNGFTSEKKKLVLKHHNTTRRNVQVIPEQDQKILSDFLLKNTDYSKLGILLCLYTGLRLGEICSLQVKDIDLRIGIIQISKTVQRINEGTGHTYFYVGSPKTDHSIREIPIPGFLSELLKNSLYGLSEHDYLATGTSCFMQPRTYQYRFKSYLAQCGLSEYHFHTLRHTFASRAIELGFDVKSLSEILGHSNVKLTLNLYVHPSIEQKRSEMERFSVFA